MKTLLYANRAEPKYISMISILLLAAAGDITKLRCMHMEYYIFASQNLWYNTLYIPCITYSVQYRVYIICTPCYIVYNVYTVYYTLYTLV